MAVPSSTRRLASRAACHSPSTTRNLELVSEHKGTVKFRCDEADAVTPCLLYDFHEQVVNMKSRRTLRSASATSNVTLCKDHEGIGGYTYKWKSIYPWIRRRADLESSEIKPQIINYHASIRSQKEFSNLAHNYLRYEPHFKACFADFLIVSILTTTNVPERYSLEEDRIASIHVARSSLSFSAKGGIPCLAATTSLMPLQYTLKASVLRRA